MAKRSANVELNHDNWDQEEAPEEAGVFKAAAPEVIMKRVIRTAKRRMPAGANPEERKNAFSAFSGFGTKSPTTSTNSESVKSTFSFLANTNGVSKSPTSEDSDPKDTTNNNYLSRLKGLNESVLEWLKMHINKNPCCILTPIFDDYAKYLEVIRKETDTAEINKADSTEIKKTDSTQQVKSDEVEFKLTPKPLNTVGSSSSASNQGQSPLLSSGTSSFPTFKPSSNLWDNVQKPPSLFSSNSDGKDSKSTGFKLGQPATNLSTGFSFGSGQPFTFGNVAAPETSNPKTEESEESEEPPKNEFKQVTEGDALFSQRVKVFVKKDGNLSDRGVGMLYVKPAPNEKHQVIVRADTSLGNIILNILLTESIPTQRVGKNNVMLMCVPTPDTKPPPIPVFLRVKTAEDADNLLTQLNKYKN